MAPRRYPPRPLPLRPVPPPPKPEADGYKGAVPDFTELWEAKMRAANQRIALAGWDAAAEAARLKLCAKLVRWADNHPNNRHVGGMLREAEAALTLLADLVAKAQELVR